MIDEIIGTVKKPSYTLKVDKFIQAGLNSKDLEEGQILFVLSDTLQIMYQEKIEEMMSEAGTDYESSCRNTIATNAEEFYSDDEKELEKMKMKKEAGKIMNANMKRKRNNNGKRRKGGNESVGNNRPQMDSELQKMGQIPNLGENQYRQVGYPVYPGAPVYVNPMMMNAPITDPETYNRVMSQINFMYQYPQQVPMPVPQQQQQQPMQAQQGQTQNLQGSTQTQMDGEVQQNQALNGSEQRQ